MSERVDSAVVFSRFAEKVTALRQTMTKVEQGMLDDMVANAEFDVDAHGVIAYRVNQAVATQKVADSAINLQSAVALEKAEDAGAVEAHALMPNQRISFRFDPAVGYKVSEGKVSEGRIANNRLEGGV